MYLSKLTLNLRDRNARRALGDCHMLHTTLMRAFPSLEEPNPRAAIGLLYRVEPSRAARVCILAQSIKEPNWADLPAWCVENETKPVVALYDRIVAGQTLTFRLRANPTKIAGERPEGGQLMNAHRKALRDPVKQMEWLIRAGERGGFDPVFVHVARRAVDGAVIGTVDVPDVRIVPEPDVRGDSHRTLGSVRFEGRLTVRDAALFRRTLADGVGRGKAYGFGLLSVAPARL
ncbi:MAG: type I-E CRISPR-associated protein Cas6/Cse3/CasE [Chloroflexota bacterium]|nr:type I-E CRISPR-associated protein Cas6/Cse3/CasE [Chloroflexota bacterium]